MKKEFISPMPDYYDRYIHLVDDLPLTVALEKHFTNIQNLNLEVLNQLGDRTYAPEKWTFKEILQHLTDWERIFSYRALVFARQEPQIPSGHDENIMGANSKANNRPLQDIIDDFLVARRSTISLFRSFDDESLLTVGQNWNMKISVLAIGFTIIGHQIHHFNIVKERYLPLIGSDLALL